MRILIVNALIIIIFICFYKIDYNSEENCIENDFCFKNLTKLNSIKVKPYLCNETTSLYYRFHSNREWSKNPNYLVATIYMYPSHKQYYSYIDFVKSFSISNSGKILFLVTFTISLYKIICSTLNMLEVKSTKKIYNYLKKLDNSYSIFKYRINNSFCYILYTESKQQYFSNKFLLRMHHTMKNRNYYFSGYYAAATNLYSVLPFMFKIFDYFDFYFKYDFDLSGSINIKEFAFNGIKTKRWYLFGTCFNLDSYYVCNNVRRMMLDYAKLRLCNRNLINLINTTNECTHLPGWFTGMWLGLYSSPEIRDFSDYYLTYQKGITQNRWGDQQFFTNSLLLFSNKNKLHYNLSYNCLI